jgi:hypothetical protein
VSIAALREGLATNLRTISGLRVVSYSPDAVEVPMAIVGAPSIDYDTAMARGSDEYTFTVDVLVSRAVSRAAQKELDAYCDPGSIKAAIESDRTLGGAAFDCRVTSLNSYRQEVVGETPYLSASFTVQVVTQ